MYVGFLFKLLTGPDGVEYIIVKFVSAATQSTLKIFDIDFDHT